LSRSGDLEHLLAPLLRQSPEERAARRTRLFRDYFAEAETVRMTLRGQPFYGLEKAVPGQLLSLKDAEGFYLALCLVLERKGEELAVLTPAVDLRQVAGVRIGDLRLDAGTGNEIQVPGIETAACT
jgi:polynucleotide 5'-kinase involved in rRNA processing